MEELKGEILSTRRKPALFKVLIALYSHKNVTFGTKELRAERGFILLVYGRA